MLIKVRAFPGEDEEEIIKKSEDSFDIKVKEKPVMGQANKGIIRVLAGYFNISESKIRLIKGFRERNKVFNIQC
jgi:uncharacterized protein YggU (UPF0235/DUF167 family)